MDHAALADFAAILDMEHFETAGVFVEVIDGACLAHHGPVYVQFDEQVFRVGVFDHVVQHDSLVLDLLAVLVGAGEEKHVAALQPQVTRVNIRRYINSRQMADMHRAVGIGESRCNEVTLELFCHIEIYSITNFCQNY